MGLVGRESCVVEIALIVKKPVRRGCLALQHGIILTKDDEFAINLYPLETDDEFAINLYPLETYTC